MFYALDFELLYVLCFGVILCFRLYSYPMFYALDLELPYVLCFRLRVTLCFML